MPKYTPINGPMQRAVMLAVMDVPGMTQNRVATRLGVDRSMVSRWLNVQSPMPMDAAFHLAKWLGPGILADACEVTGLRVDRDVRSPDDVDREVSDIRKRLAYVVGRIAEAQDPDSDGGHDVSPGEAKGMLPDIRALIQEAQDLEAALASKARELRVAS